MLPLLFIAGILFSGSPTGQVTGNSISLPDSLKRPETNLINSGYGGSRTTGELPGSVIRLQFTEFNRGFITSPEELFAGKTPGLSVNALSGAPGAYFRLSDLRNSSLLSSTSPLVLVNDMPLAGTPVLINPNDIESITYFRNPTDAGIFGSQAGNGVLVITTKRGTDGLKFSYSGKLALSVIRRKYDVFDAGEFRDLVNTVFGSDSEASSYLGDYSTDWQDEIYMTALSHSHHFSISGSILDIPFRLGAGKTLQQGIIRTSGLDRSTLSFAADPHLLNNNLRISFNANAVFDNNRDIDGSVPRYAAEFDPTQPVFDGNDPGNGYYTQWYPTNPVAMIYLSDYRTRIDRWVGNLKAEYKLPVSPDIRVSLNYGIDNIDRRSHNVNDTALALTYSQGLGRSVDDNSSAINRQLDLYIGYSGEIESVSTRFEFTGGISKWNSRTDEYYRAATLFPSFSTYRLTSSWQESGHDSWFARLFLSVKERYIMTVNVRDDGNSGFSGANRRSLFPSLSFIWNIKEEPFAAGMKPFRELRLYAGYGFKGAFQSTDLPAGIMALSNLRQEAGSFINTGIDWAIIDNRLRGSLGFYHNVNHNLITKVQVPSGSGLSNYMMINAGKTGNTGLEFTLNASVISNSYLDWRIGYFATLHSNRVLDLAGEGIEGIAAGNTGMGGYVQMISPGFPVTSYYLYEQVYDSEGFPVEGLYADRTGDGTVDAYDRYHFSKSTPGILMGVSSNLTLRNWEFAFSGRASLGNSLFNIENAAAGYSNIYSADALKNISKQVSYSHFYNINRPSDFYVENASFFRMDFISLGYTFKRFVKNSVSLKASAVIQNAFLITGYKGQDPETTGGVSSYAYPGARTASLELSLDF